MYSVHGSTADGFVCHRLIDLLYCKQPSMQVQHSFFPCTNNTIVRILHVRRILHFSFTCFVLFFVFFVFFVQNRFFTPPECTPIQCRYPVYCIYIISGIKVPHTSPQICRALYSGSVGQMRLFQWTIAALLRRQVLVVLFSQWTHLIIVIKWKAMS